MKNLHGTIAAITGAASGIGRALARQLAAKGCRLSLADVDGAGLRETSESLAPGTACTTHLVDVTDRDAVYRFAAETAAAHGGVDVVVNNAGVAAAGTVEEMSDETFEWVVAVNFWGVVHGTRAFLPHLRRRPRGHIVNISSIFGLVAAPRVSAYNATKFAVRGFTESLRQELRDSCINVTSVHPGGVATNIARRARVEGSRAGAREHFVAEFEKNFVTTADDAARRIVRGILRGERRVLVGRDAVLGDLLARLFPVSYWRITNKLIRGLD